MTALMNAWQKEGTDSPTELPACIVQTGCGQLWCLACRRPSLLANRVSGCNLQAPARPGQERAHLFLHVAPQARFAYAFVSPALVSSQ